MRRDQAAAFMEPDKAALGTATHRAGHIQGGRFRELARKGPVAHNSLHRFDSMNVRVEGVDHLRANLRRLSFGLGRSRNGRSDFEQISLYLLDQILNFLILAD